jgi:hypothetical protein
MTETMPGVCLFTTKDKKVLQDNRLIPLYSFQFQDKCVFSQNVHHLCPQSILTSNAYAITLLGSSSNSISYIAGWCLV